MLRLRPRGHDEGGLPAVLVGTFTGICGALAWGRGAGAGKAMSAPFDLNDQQLLLGRGYRIQPAPVEAKLYCATLARGALHPVDLERRSSWGAFRHGQTVAGQAAAPATATTGSSARAFA